MWRLAFYNYQQKVLLYPPNTTHKQMDLFDYLPDNCTGPEYRFPYAVLDCEAPKLGFGTVCFSVIHTSGPHPCVVSPLFLSREDAFIWAKTNIPVDSIFDVLVYSEALVRIPMH